MQFQGFETYAPREQFVRRIRGHRVKLSRWLFPRYIFVWVTHQWHQLFNTIGVSRVLLNGELPARLPDHFVPTMRTQERNGFIVLPKHRFKIGQEVHVASGLFRGAKGLYQGMTQHQREIVLIGSLGRVELASGLLQ